MRAVVFALIVAFAVGARADAVPPPPVPQMPDEPLPEWHPPPPSTANALSLQTLPEVQGAQKLRQAGLWISSFGWAQLLLSGILYAWAAQVNKDLSSPPSTSPQVFDPTAEDQRNRIEAATTAFLSIGGAMAVGGFVLYTIGQWKLTARHKSHPSEPVPSLSGN